MLTLLSVTAPSCSREPYFRTIHIRDSLKQKYSQRNVQNFVATGPKHPPFYLTLASGPANIARPVDVNGVVVDVTAYRVQNHFVNRSSASFQFGECLFRINCELENLDKGSRYRTIWERYYSPSESL